MNDRGPATVETLAVLMDRIIEELQKMDAKLDRFEEKREKLATRVTIVEGEMENVVAEVAEQKDNSKWSWRFSVGTFASAAIAFLVWVGNQVASWVKSIGHHN